MAQATRSFTVLDTPQHVWSALADFSRWSRYLRIRNAQKTSGWGSVLEPRGACAQGTPLAMLADGRVVQEWVIESWRPAEQLRVASREWHGTPLFAMRSSIQAALSSTSPAETQVQLSIDLSFCDPSWGWLLNFCPMRSVLDRALVDFEKGLLDALAGA